MSDENKNGFRVKIQRFGSHLSGMIMPNIGAFIAWGLITALFIETGWAPNKELAKLVSPMITYLLPLLIGYTGGKMVYAERGGVVGAIATMGVIVGADIPMFLGAMVMGPLGGYLIKKVDDLFRGKIKAGFEMLVNNFSAGILGALIAIIGFKYVGPIVAALSNFLSNGVELIVNANLLPLASIFIEPAKVLFLNNAINQGILGPIGVEQAKEVGKSILFLLESNPGPGFGVLLAYCIFGRGTSRQTAPGAAIIHFLGGIHEIYFPYILMKPVMLLAVIAGGMGGVFTFTLFDAGLVATPSPGSIIALMMMAPKGQHLGVIAGVVVATIISFVIAAIILKTSKDKEEDINAATEKMEALKGKKSSVASAITETTATPDAAETSEFDYKSVKKVIFACDAGMGSSAMGASIMRNKVKKAGIEGVDVTNTSIANLPSDADLVITHKDLTDRAVEKLPTAHHVSVENFMNSPKYDEIIEKLK
ncbi:PTS family mannitol-permease II, BC component [Niallia circulans]|jgi:mannitol PTS system EIICBA or EIICB component|uniref:PTS system mannitol-specific EIICB component n=1 Tax=Niallia circulans TaxID=1397 RepID=A0A0J1L0B9_NIACI|nr:PTS mannitol transporter subunit IICB [Niallia circulans]KLV22495.1 PTS system mannitol-specific transporter subunit IIBC [Niallia circulans]MDR4318326.1 PTS mannitol transporter subunit IICB [Niallia circulans]MED3840438.1 PTS mannitol transporter subunit IICB [Niallia circulans]MED4243227.1 PTS mannitol transporter subunit IICB [Niallia circulans]MED4250050.1 PTS mannitol transporter subunit IICB [Niallia circulans]